jgi:hypothetical protein
MLPERPFDKPEYDLVSLGVVAVVGIIAVVLMVINLVPVQSAPTDALTGNSVRKASSYEQAHVPVDEQFNVALFDFNRDGRLDLYDYADVLAGRVDCQAQACDLNADGRLDAVDLSLFTQLLRRLYDYNNDGVVDRNDPIFLRDIMLGNAKCDKDHVCDLNSDGFVSSEDLALYTSFVYNYENPVLSR